MVRYAAAVLLVLATTFADVAALQLSADAMDCCAKTDYECAGIQTPDDCCQTMGHSAHIAPATTPQSAPQLTGPGLATSLTIVSPISHGSDRPSSTSTFKRPHDPPHLHPVPLLI